MIQYIGIDESGRILVTTDQEEYASEDMIQFDFPEDFDFAKQDEYRIQNGELIHDPIPPDPSIRIAELKQKLSATDYVVIKLSESSLTGSTLSADDNERYSDIIEQRRVWRDEINQLEAEEVQDEHPTQDEGAETAN